MRIDDFNVSEQCLQELKRTGVTTVEDIVFFLDQYAKSGGGTFRAKWVKCFDEIVAQLKRLNLWSENMEKFWPSDEQS